MGTQNGHNVPFLESASLKKRKRNVMKRIRSIFPSVDTHSAFLSNMHVLQNRTGITSSLGDGYIRQLAIWHLFVGQPSFGQTGFSGIILASQSYMLCAMDWSYPVHGAIGI